MPLPLPILLQKNTRTAASEAGLEALNTVDPPDAPSASFLTGTTSIGSHQGGVDITLPFFRDLLADKPIPGANAIGSLSNWSEQAAGTADKDKKTVGNTTWDGEAATLTF